jgi:hypothetical protein
MYYTSPTFNLEVARALMGILGKGAAPPGAAGRASPRSQCYGLPPGHPETIPAGIPDTPEEIQLWMDALGSASMGSWQPPRPPRKSRGRRG